MRAERGAALLEVLAAMVILAVAGVGLVGVVLQALQDADRARAREFRYAEAASQLTRLSLRDAHGLDLRLGRRAVGAWITSVDRPRPGLYRLAIADTLVPEEELVVTIVRRPEGR
jgi:type II secretory pathway pseudopilin PulG